MPPAKDSSRGSRSGKSTETGRKTTRTLADQFPLEDSGEDEDEGIQVSDTVTPMHMNVMPLRIDEASKQFWRRITSQYSLGPDEGAMLNEIVKEMTIINRLQFEIDRSGLTSLGSYGQSVVNPMLIEIRQHRGILTRLMKGLELPESDEQSSTRKARVSAINRENVKKRWGA